MSRRVRTRIYGVQNAFYEICGCLPSISGKPLLVEVNMQVRSMGPISEIDMVRQKSSLQNLFLLLNPPFVYPLPLPSFPPSPFRRRRLLEKRHATIIYGFSPPPTHEGRGWRRRLKIQERRQKESKFTSFQICVLESQEEGRGRGRRRREKVKTNPTIYDGGRRESQLRSPPSSLVFIPCTYYVVYHLKWRFSLNDNLDEFQ